MKYFSLQRFHLAGFAFAALLVTAVLSGCYYEDDYYGYGDGYQPAYYGDTPYYATPQYAPAYRSTVYEAPEPYYRTSPRYYYQGSSYVRPRYYDNDYYRSNGPRYYNNDYDHDHNRYNKTATYRRDYDSNLSPSQQRKIFVEKAKDHGRYDQHAEDSVEKDRKKEQSKDHKKKK